MKRQTITDIICILFIILFVYAATSKLIDYQKFKIQLSQSPLLTNFARVVAILIPLIEILIAIALCLRRYKLMALYCSFSLMTLFSAYIYVVTRYSDYIPCSCGGILQKMSWGQHLIFNIVFLLLALLAILLSEQANQYNSSLRFNFFTARVNRGSRKPVSE